MTQAIFVCDEHTSSELSTLIAAYGGGNKQPTRQPQDENDNRPQTRREYIQILCSSVIPDAMFHAEQDEEEALEWIS